MTASHLPSRGGHGSPATNGSTPVDPDPPRASDPAAQAADELRSGRLLALTEPSPLAIRWGLVVIGALVIAGLFTLVYGGAPTYDPWAWIIWGREIIHGNLVTTSGPSWKPLPMIFTVPFALFGGAAPDLWMWIARAAALVGIVAVAELASRLGGRLAAGLAGLAITLAPMYYAYGLQGSSEGVLVLVCCLAATSWLDNHKDRAFWWLVAAALLRPEVWPFVAVLGINRIWGNPRKMLWVGGAGVIVVVAWLVPEQLGSGSLMRAAQRAHDPNPDSAAFAAHPWLNVLGSMANLMLWVPGIGVILALAFGLLAWRRSDDRRPIGKDVLRTAAFLGIISLGWIAIVAVMTEGGYAGNPRYLAAPLGILVAVGLGGVSWLVRALAHHGGSTFAELLVMVALVALVTVAAVRLPARTEEIIWQKENRAELSDLAKDPAKKAAILACGPIVTHPLVVPPFAWTFDVHIDQVLSDDPPPARGTYVVGTNAHSRPVRPLLAEVDGYREVTRTGQLTIVQNCGR